MGLAWYVYAWVTRRRKSLINVAMYIFYKLILVRGGGCSHIKVGIYIFEARGVGAILFKHWYVYILVRGGALPCKSWYVYICISCADWSVTSSAMNRQNIGGLLRLLAYLRQGVHSHLKVGMHILKARGVLPYKKWYVYTKSEGGTPI